MKISLFTLYILLALPLVTNAQSSTQNKVSYDEIKLFPLTHQLVGIRRDSLWAIFDSTGQQRTPFRFTNIDMASDSAVVASTTNAAWFGAWDLQLNPIIPEKYHELKILPAGFWQATLYGQSALLDRKGKTKTDFRFFKILGMPDGRFFATSHHNQLMYPYNADGRPISDRRYEARSAEGGLFEAISDPDNHLTLLFSDGQVQEYELVDGGIATPEKGDPADWKRLIGGSYDEYRGWLDLKTKHVEQPNKYIHVTFQNDQIKAFDHEHAYTFDRNGNLLKKVPVSPDFPREEHTQFQVTPSIFQLNPSARSINRRRKLPAHWGMIVNKINTRFQLCDVQNKPLVKDTFDQIIRIGQPGLIAVVRKGNKAFEVKPTALLSAPYEADSFLKAEEKYLFYKKGAITWIQNLLTGKKMPMPEGQFRPVPYSDLFIVSSPDTASLYDQNFYKGPLWTGESILIYEFNDHKPFQMIAKKEGKMGILSSAGQVILPFEYDQITYNEEGYTPFLKLQKGDKVGSFNCISGLSIPAEYPDLPIFYETSGFFLLTKNNKAALFSSDYRQLTAFEFAPQTLIAFGKDLVCLANNGKYMLLDGTGQQLPGAVFDHFEVVHATDYAFFKKDNYFGCMRQDGKIILEPRHASLKGLSKNTILAGFPDGAVQIYNLEGQLISQEAFERVTLIDDTHFMVESEGKYGVINRTGIYTIPLNSQYFNCNYGACPLVYNGKTGLYKPDGTLLLSPQYDQIWGAFDQSGIFLVQKGGLFGYCNWKGEWLTEITYDFARPFFKEWAAVRKSGKWGYLNKKGATTIPFIFDFAENFDHKETPEAIVAYQKSHWRIDTSGTLLQEIPHTELSFLANDLTPLRVVTTPRKDAGLQYVQSDTWLLEPTGYQLYPILYDLMLYAKPTTNGVLFPPFGLMNYAGTPLTERSFDELILSSIWTCDMIPAKKGDKWGFINTKGDTVIPIIYDNVWNLQDPYPNGQWRGGVLLNGKPFYVDKTGTKVAEE